MLLLEGTVRINKMKKVCVTFDDGRADNYCFALPILEKYEIAATFFITTGYIDHSFSPNTWRTSEGPMTVDELREILELGYEIGLHGDRHVTGIEDFLMCYEKAKNWFGLEKFGYSIPGSRMTDYPIDDFIRINGEKLLYLRGGNIGGEKNRIIKKIHKALSVYLNNSLLFQTFNQPNIILKTQPDKVIPSVGIRSIDSPSKILKFIDSVNDGQSIVFMFHSILPSSSDYYGRDEWAWSESNFEMFCRYLCSLQNNGLAESIPMINLISAETES